MNADSAILKSIKACVLIVAYARKPVLFRIGMNLNYLEKVMWQNISRII